MLTAVKAVPIVEQDARRPVDHANRQTLDNRRANLRWSDHVRNRRNSGARGTAPTLDAIVLQLLAELGPRPEIQEVPF